MLSRGTKWIEPYKCGLNPTHHHSTPIFDIQGLEINEACWGKSEEHSQGVLHVLYRGGANKHVVKSKSANE